MDQEEERQAVLDVKAGAVDRFAFLVDAHKGALFNLAWRMTGSRSDAEDLVQEIFVRAFRNLGSFDSEKRFFPWLYTIGINLIRSRLKSVSKRRRVLQDQEKEGSQEASPEDAFLEKERADQVQAALLKLNTGQREALLLRYSQGLTYDEIAVILRISNSAAKMRAARGLDRLRSILPETLLDKG
ncbi:RNA polymerase sigma-70 factor, ECF subfamily [Desulfatibacillum alkenivorans DSM 16219]|jgi:RNA polymerase sigma-70 factor (ECF subfamily)|uniref:RNA polymerase sigma-70 factor, ECF subfamily n=1 Tax=Desulfatibacillum alkenivorans DSM 16219 TaxID=1121393 RepID=A0A1M6NXW5_9BACT|nr:sigma-70 family RNA polymerase sigma factor [Desulfatibacillum alkenivorans]SHK00502.1 RNA polymerase sigma-70 factor, ECF subfamily [Desulfatibacillum alkenivorans DSM 16219]